MMINSVLGPISTDDLGKTLIHEHVTCCSWDMRMAFGKKWLDPDILVEEAVKMWDDAYDNFGVKTIVDGTPINLGRDVHLIEAVAKKCKCQILMSSGIYYSDDPFLRNKPADQLVELFVDECKNGISGTKILPAILKCGVGPNGFTPIADMLLEVNAKVQKATGLPVFAHTESQQKGGNGVQDRLEKHGADLTRLIVGHSGDTNDIDYLIGLMKRGSYLGLDRFGECNYMNSVENRVDTMCKLIDKGWIHKLLLSHDLNVYYDWADNDFYNNFANVDNVNRQWTHTYIFKEAVPLMKERGITDKELNIMFVDNVKNFFEGK